MHIDKNICERIIGTLLHINGKCKDSEKVRLDMQRDEDITDQAPPPPLGPVARARARELNYVIMLKNDGPED
jgi:hypothetical protein